MIANPAIGLHQTRCKLFRMHMGSPFYCFLFGANLSFATPFGYQTNLLILSAGGYKFSDFLKVGVPLAIIMWIGISIVLPLLYDIQMQ